MEKVIVIGSGIAGLTCAYYLKRSYQVTVLEKKSFYGGLCQSFEISGFYFDYGGHVAFSKDETVRNLLETNIDITDEVGESYNYKKGVWVKNPVQNNLFVLPVGEKIKIIEDFVEKKDDRIYANYGDWLKKKYGIYFAYNYPYLYTKKYWTVKPEMLETKWVGIRMYTPTLEEVLKGAFTKKTSHVHYSGSTRYPNGGGFGRFLNNISKELDILFNANIEKIDISRHKLVYNNKSIDFDKLIVTCPLPDVVDYIEDIPKNVYNAAKNLNHTSLVLVSLGVKGENIMPQNSKAFYIYDEDKIASRVYSTSRYGKNNAPKGCSTIQAEVYYSKYKKLNMSLEEVKEKVIQDFIDMKLFSREDIIVEDVREEKYANIMFTHDIYDNRKCVHDFLSEKGIFYAGRFGSWDYLWSDQSMLDAKRVAESILSSRGI